MVFFKTCCRHPPATFSQIKRYIQSNSDFQINRATTAMALESKKLQRKILCYSIGTLILIASMITIISIIPFYKNLQKFEMRDLIFLRNTNMLIANEYTNHLKEIALTTSRKLKTIQTLNNYLTHNIDFNETQRLTIESLSFSLKKNPNLVGMQRFDSNNQLISALGQTLPIYTHRRRMLGVAPSSRDPAPSSRGPAPSSSDPAPSSSDPAPSSRDPAPSSRGLSAGSSAKKTWIPDISLKRNSGTTGKEFSITGPYIINNRYLVLVNSPLFNHNKQFLGSEKMLFDISELISKIYTNAQKKLGDILLANLNNGRAEIFAPQGSPWRQQLNTENSPLKAAINSAINKNITATSTEKIAGKHVIILYGPITNMNWSLLVVVPEKNLLIPIRNTLINNVVSILIVVVLFILILIALLKPLSGKLLLHISDLKNRIKHAKQKLKESNEQLGYLTMHDTLTSSANRRGFDIRIHEEISRASRYGREFSLLFIDVDKFKNINDHYGHKVGDELLIHFSEFANSTLRSEDFIARIGGDEFIIILPEIASEEKTNPIIKKLKDPKHLSFTAKNGEVIKYNISIGAATFPTHGKTPDELFKVADANMYNDKGSDTCG